MRKIFIFSIILISLMLFFLPAYAVPVPPPTPVSPGGQANTNPNTLADDSFLSSTGDYSVEINKLKLKIVELEGKISLLEEKLNNVEKPSPFGTNFTLILVIAVSFGLIIFFVLWDKKKSSSSRKE
jgi:hypothetical protein